MPWAGLRTPENIGSGRFRMAWRPSRVLIVLLPVLLCLSPGRPAAAGSIDISVMTQNLYTGADTAPIIMADSIPALQNTIAVATQSVIANNFPARATAIAAEAAKSRWSAADRIAGGGDCQSGRRVAQLCRYSYRCIKSTGAHLHLYDPWSRGHGPYWN